MEEYSAKKNIIKMIETLKSEYQIVDFIEENIPKELLEDYEFIEKLIEVNPKAEMALEILSGKETSKKIIEEIETKGLNATIEDKEKLKKVPKRYRKELYQIAQNYEQEEDFEKAKEIYARIVEFGIDQVDRFYKRTNEKDKAKETIYYKSKFAYYKCKIQNGEKLTEEDMAELENLAKEDKYNILGLTQKGRITAFELFEALFEDITIEEIEHVILPIISSNKGGKGGVIYPPGPITENEYEADLSPEKRLEHLKTDFEIESCKIGKGKFAGTFIFKVKNSDVVIVEKFYDIKGRKDNKLIVPSYGAATYYVHKDAQIDLEKSDRSKLVERKKEELRKDEDGTSLKLIDSRIHKGKNYYKDQKRIFEEIEENGRELARIESGREQEQHIDNILEEPEYGEDINSQPSGEEQIEEIMTRDTIDNKGENQETSKQTDGIEDIILEESIIEGETQEDDDKSSDYTLEEMISLIEEFDKEYEEFQNQLAEIDKTIGELNIKIETLKEEINQHLEGLVTRENVKETIKEGIKILNECKIKKKELEALKEKIIVKEKENRGERDKLKEEFRARIKGEE